MECFDRHPSDAGTPIKEDPEFVNSPFPSQVSRMGVLTGYVIQYETLK